MQPIKEPCPRDPSRGAGASFMWYPCARPPACNLPPTAFLAPSVGSDTLVAVEPPHDAATTSSRAAGCRYTARTRTSWALPVPVIAGGRCWHFEAETHFRSPRHPEKRGQNRPITHPRVSPSASAPPGPICQSRLRHASTAPAPSLPLSSCVQSRIQTLQRQQHPSVSSHMLLLPCLRALCWACFPVCTPSVTAGRGVRGPAAVVPRTQKQSMKAVCPAADDKTLGISQRGPPRARCAASEALDGRAC